jgi:hypothetical protein
MIKHRLHTIALHSALFAAYALSKIGPTTRSTVRKFAFFCVSISLASTYLKKYAKFAPFLSEKLIGTPNVRMFQYLSSFRVYRYYYTDTVFTFSFSAILGRDVSLFLKLHIVLPCNISKCDNFTI